MAVLSPEERLRQRRAKSEQAITLAMKNRWEDAAQVNREILEIFPDEVDAHNRLGKALTELGRYADARESYASAVRLDPANSIASKNMQRLSKLVEEGASAPPPSAVDPRLFIEESGKTTVTPLTDVPRSDRVAKLTAGDQLQLQQHGNQIEVTDLQGERIGRIEPKLEQDLIRLQKLGNRYSVVVTAVHEHSVHVIIRETHRSSAMGSKPSFRPTAAPDGGLRSYTRAGLLRFGADEDEEDEELTEEEEEEEVEVEAEVEVGAAAGPARPEADAPEVTPLEVLVEKENADTPDET